MAINPEVVRRLEKRIAELEDRLDPGPRLPAVVYMSKVNVVRERYGPVDKYHPYELSFDFCNVKPRDLSICQSEVMRRIESGGCYVKAGCGNNVVVAEHPVKNPKDKYQSDRLESLIQWLKYMPLLCGYTIVER
jgi:rRNA maturation protein Nop10